MTISEPSEEAGFFWQPDKPEERVPGFLRVSQWGAATLETISLDHPVDGDGSLANPGLGGHPMRFERIIGITKGGPVTLEDCTLRSFTARFGGGLSTSLLDANQLFVGVGYGRDSQIAFSELRFSIRGLDEWLGISGIQVVHHEGKGVSVHFDLPDPIRLKISDEIRLEFNFSGSVPTGFDVSKARIAQKAHVSLISSTEKPLEDLLALTCKVRDFLSFVLTKATHIDSCTGFSNDVVQKGGNTPRKVPVEIHFRSSPPTDPLPEHKSQDMLFAFSEVKEDCENVLARWIGNHNAHEPVFNRYFLLDLGHSMDLERRFCLLYEGMAAIHKSRFPEKAGMKDRLRLKEMMKPFERFFGTDDETTVFVERVSEARNYLIHLHEDGGDATGNVDRLWTLNCRLEALFQLYLLRTIGIGDAQLDRIVENNSRIRGYLEQNVGSP